MKLWQQVSLIGLLQLFGLALVVAQAQNQARENVSGSSPEICLIPANIKLSHLSPDTSFGLWGRALAGRTDFPRQRIATGRNVFIFDPRKPAWAAYNSRGRLVKTGIASGGKGYCRDVGRRCLTVRGQFSVHHKGNANCKSSKYPLGKGGAPMPYCMFFYRGYAIHGSHDVPKYNASHGCIRVLPKDAAWLHRNFINIGTQVIVKSY